MVRKVRMVPTGHGSCRAAKQIKSARVTLAVICTLGT